MERFTFRQRSQLQSESTVEYVSVLRELAKTCSFGSMEDELIRDVVVEKTIHPKLWERFLQDRELTLEKVLSASDAYERSIKGTSLMSGKTEPVTVAKVFSKPSQPQLKSCTNSGRADHIAYASQCPARRATCKACGKRGHYAAMCQSSAAAAGPGPAGATAVSGATRHPQKQVPQRQAYHQ